MNLIDISEERPKLFLDDINYLFDGILLVYHKDILIGQIVYSTNSDLWIFIKCVDVDNHSYSDSTLKTLITFIKNKYGSDVTVKAAVFD